MHTASSAIEAGFISLRSRLRWLMDPASFLEVPNYQIICDVKSWNKYTIGFIRIKGCVSANL